MIRYLVRSDNPASHLFNVQMIIEAPCPKAQEISLPNWIPGSYLIRDFARHIVSIKAQNCSIKKSSSNIWICENITGAITLDYVVYAFDISVRGAYCGENHAFFNGSSLFLQAHAKEHEKCEVLLIPPKRQENAPWKVATTLKSLDAPCWGFGTYYADSYEALIDHPVMLGDFQLEEFKVHDIPHAIAIMGQHEGDIKRLAEDVAKICQTHLDLFQDTPPFDRYLFILTVTKEGYGGLEHRASSALITQRAAFEKNAQGPSRAYIGLLGLFSHEYFHAWHIKKIKPSAFMPYDLNQKNYTQQLWVFEGFTSYYDDLALVRSKIITGDKYLNLLAEKLTKLLRNPGKNVQTLVESSFDAWIKFYCPNENSINVEVSYYLKGSLVALAIDILLRESGNLSLDNIMRTLWQEYGKKGIGVPEGKIEALLHALGNEDLSDFITTALYTTQDLPFKMLLEKMGLSLTLRQAQSLEDLGGVLNQKSVAINQGSLGIKFTKNNGRVMIQSVFTGSAASEAGLSAQDEIIAINGIKVDETNIEKILNRLTAHQKISMHLFRQDVLQEKLIIIKEASIDTAEISVMSTSEEQKLKLEMWLHL